MGSSPGSFMQVVSMFGDMPLGAGRLVVMVDGARKLYRPYWSDRVLLIMRPVKSRMVIGTKGGANFSPKLGAFGSNSFWVSSRIKPRACAATGTSVNSQKSAAALAPVDRVTSLVSHSSTF